MTPTVSIILPTYNRAKTLERAIDSVLNQTFNDFELIIIDDGSTDETCEVLSAYSDHHKIRLISQPRRGCSIARNVGIRLSQGRYIAFQDSDDEWMLDKLEKAIDTLESCGPEVGVFYSDMLQVAEDNSHVYFHSPDVQKGILIDEKRLDYQVAAIGIQSAVIRRECFDKAGLFDESLHRFIDLELFIRLSDHFQFFHFKEPLVKYYACEGISKDSDALVFARQYLIDKYRQRLEEHEHHLSSQHLHLKIALYEAHMAKLSSQLSDHQVQLERITNSRGWRLLQYYGRIKHRYLLPVYRLLIPQHSGPEKK